MAMSVRKLMRVDSVVTCIVARIRGRFVFLDNTVQGRGLADIECHIVADGLKSGRICEDGRPELPSRIADDDHRRRSLELLAKLSGRFPRLQFGCSLFERGHITR